MHERRGWAEGLVRLGGGTLAVMFILPFLQDWGPLADDLIPPAGLVAEILGEAGHAGIGQALLAVTFLSSPYFFGAFVLWESFVAGRPDPGDGLRFRVVLRGFLGMWLALSILLPAANPGTLDPTFRILCLVFASLLILAWLVVGRWVPPRSHTVFMRRGCLLGAGLVALWFSLLLIEESMIFVPSVAASLASGVLIAIGSVAALFGRPEPE